MKVLLLHRQSFGAIAAHVRDLKGALKQRGYDADIVDATEWMPLPTGRKTDKAVSERLKKLCEPYDLVHAFGYRCAWACGVAIGYGEAWVYSAIDMPKTTHRLLIDKLNCAQFGICSSYAVRKVLDEAMALDLVMIPPGVPDPPSPPPTKAEARAQFDLPEGAKLLVGMSRWVSESGLSALIDALPQVAAEHPDVLLAIAGEGPMADDLQSRAKSVDSERVRILGCVTDPLTLLSASDLIIVPESRSGFSRVACEAMALSRAVLLRHGGGLPEMVDPEISGFLFASDELLGSRIVELLGLPITLETVGSAARIRVLDRYHIDQCADRIVDTYRSVLED